MDELCGVDNTYSVVHLKRKIKEYFGNSILFTEEEEEGKPSVLTSFFKGQLLVLFLLFCGNYNYLISN